MQTEMCQIEFDISEITCENCKEVFYTYSLNNNNVCPHCNHSCSDENISSGTDITDSILIELDRKTMKFVVYN